MSVHKILNISPSSPDLQSLFSKDLGISKILAQILVNRGIKTSRLAREFLNAGLESLIDPYSFKDMRRAVDIIRKAARDKTKVMLFGDYDADGITSLVLLKNTLAQAGIRSEHHIPHRIKDGYGLNKNILHLAKEKRIGLLITVDCGTSSVDYVSELERLGTKVIITDHHEPLSRQDPSFASAVINPKLKDARYGFRDLAGVGVAYKLCQALSGKDLFEDLDLVALGTIADSVPLYSENRIIAREGLKRIFKTKRPGLKALMETSGITDKETTPYFVSFILGPRINASGRIDTAETAMKLLMSEDIDEAKSLAKIVETQNRQRQKIEGAILEEAQDLIDKEVNFKEHKILVMAKEGWHIGVLGVVASKLSDRLYRPIILISLGKDSCRGSGRSRNNFHLFQGMLKCKDLLENFGGHKHAVGLSINKDKIEKFKDRINRFAQQVLSFDDLLPHFDIDMEISLSDLNEPVTEELNSLGPFGSGNPEPLFYTRNLRLKGQFRLLGRDTVKFWVTDGRVTYPAIGFGMARFSESFATAESFDLIYTPKIDSWQETKSIILEISDIFFK